MDETPDQILARLQRHAESVRRAPVPGAHARSAPPPPAPGSASGLPPRSLLRTPPRLPQSPSAPTPPTQRPVPGIGPSAPSTIVIPFGAQRSSDFIPNDALRAVPMFGLILRTIAGQSLAVASCVVALMATIHLSSVTGLVVVGTCIAIAAIGAARRIPFCGWCLLGLVIGLTLGRFS